MGKDVSVEASLAGRFPGLKATVTRLTNLTVQRNLSSLERMKEQVIADVKAKYSLETLKGEALFRSYRDFFWRLGVDPTKNRPAAEALIRRILAGKPIPNINSLVDSYNLASIQTGIALAAFDASRIRGELLMRFAKTGENFLGIGMENPMKLNGGEVVVSDDEKLVAVYPYRDAEASKVTEKTVDMILMVCGCPGIDAETLSKAERVAVELILKFNEGSEA